MRRVYADQLLVLNQMLSTQGLAEPFRLARDDAWIKQVRTKAEKRLEGNGGDGLAGVREPRRPRPDADGSGQAQDLPEEEWGM